MYMVLFVKFITTIQFCLFRVHRIDTDFLPKRLQHPFTLRLAAGRDMEPHQSCAGVDGS